MTDDTARYLSMIQYNMRKDKDGTMAPFLRDERVLSADVIAVQEPWSNPYQATTHHPQKDLYHLAWPSDEIPRETGRSPVRVCMFIHKRIDPRSIQIVNHSGTFQTVILNYRHGSRDTRLAIHNLYLSPHTPSVAEEVMPATETLKLADQALTRFANHEQVLLGDFNAWHSEWFGRRVKQTGQARRIREITAKHELELVLEPGTITRPGENPERGSSTIDLIWGTHSITEHVAECTTVEFLAQGSDHLPIRTVLGFRPEIASVEERWNLKKTNWSKFENELRTELRYPRALQTKAQIDQTAEDLVEAITRAVDVSTPKVKLSHRMRPGWSDECREALKAVKRARRRYQAYGGWEELREWKQLEQKKKKILARALSDDHRQRVSETDSIKQLWSLNKWVKNRGATRTAFLPAIRDSNGNRQEDSENKAKALQDKLFPHPAPADLSDIPSNPSLPPPWPFPEITQHEVREAIRSSKGNNAPGRDGIQNQVLKMAAPTITPRLTTIYNACLKLHHWPAVWKEATVVIIRKPGKKDYLDPKAYRPISLLNTLSKNMEYILAQRISATAELNKLLPLTHCGGRKSSSCEHAIHLLMEKIHVAWKKKETASLLLLDVSGAFDNVNHQRLLWNIRELGFHEDLVGWMASFLAGRSGRMRLTEGLMPPFNIASGIPQGSPLSPVLWLLYNYKILQISKENALITGYVDDTCVLVDGKTTEETCQKLSKVHKDLERWAGEHGAVFAPQKYGLVHFFRYPSTTDPEEKQRRVRLTLQDGTTQQISPSETARYLGVWLDSGLQGKYHAQRALGEATKQKEALRGIAGAAWGVRLPGMIQLYKATILPRLLYGCSVWAPLHRGWGFKGYYIEILRKIKRFQKEALAAATGALRTTAAAAMDVELHVEPIELRMKKLIYDTVSRIRSSPIYEKILQIRREAPERLETHGRQSWNSPLQKIESTIKTITNAGRIPVEIHTACAIYPWWQPPQSVIAPDDSRARKAHDDIVEQARTDPGSWAVAYSDGSEIDQRVGSAAALITDKVHTLNYYMGASTISTIYGAELYGICIALYLALSHAPGRRTVVFTDNQAVIQAIQRPTNKSGQQYIKTIIHFMDELRNKGSTICIHWIPGHSNIRGNDWVDRLAKEATGWTGDGQPRSPPTSMIPGLVQMRSAISRKVKAVNKRDWHQSWRTGKFGRELFELIKEPHVRTLQIYDNLPRILSSILIRARTGAINLKGYLGRRGIVPSRDCDCGHGVETVKHLVLHCQLHNNLRRQIWGSQLPTDLWGELGKVASATKIARFLLKTGALGHIGRAERSTQASLEMPIQD